MPDTDPLLVSEPRHVRLFRNGRNQAVRIPVEFELPGDTAIIHREGDRLVIEPAKPGNVRGLLAVLQTLEPLEERLPDLQADLLPLRDIDL